MTDGYDIYDKVAQAKGLVREVFVAFPRAKTADDYAALLLWRTELGVA